MRLRRCRHERIRCIHGDEIWQTMSAWRGRIARARCLDCGKALRDLPLPEMCAYTGEAHR